MSKRTLILSFVLAVTGFMAGVLGSVLFGWDWILTAILALALVTLATIGLAVFDAGHPPAWGSGFWSAYVEMSGHEARGSGPSDMTRPASGWNTELLAATIAPILTIIGLLLWGWLN